MVQAVREKENYTSAVRLYARTREGRDPAWLVSLRGKAAETFGVLEFPTTRDEEWKYTSVAPLLRVPFRQMIDLDEAGVSAERLAQLMPREAGASLLVFLNGIYAPGLSQPGGESDEPGGAVVCNFSEVPAEAEEVFRQRLGSVAGAAESGSEVFTSLNTAMLGDGALIWLPRGASPAGPIHLLFVSTTTEPTVSHPRILIVADEGSSGCIVESYASLYPDIYFTNAVTEVVVAEGASIEHYRLQEESERAYHIGTTRIRQERNSRYNSLAISLGGELARHTFDVALAGEGIETTVNGLYVVTGRQHVDNHTSIDHQRPDSRSWQIYKGILDGRSRAVFNGKVFVREGALRTDARQLNKNLLLSGDATVDTKPQLEILADDVKCAHGATVGQLENDELFYLASRGIPAERARALLTFGFAEDLIRRISVESVRERLDRVVLDKLHQSLEVE